MDTEGELRSKQPLVDRQTLNAHINLYALTPQYDISETTLTEVWLPSLYHIAEQSLVLHAGGEPREIEEGKDVNDGSNVSFTLYTDKKPYKRVARILVKKQNYKYAMLAKGEHQNSILMVMAEPDRKPNPCQLVFLEQGSDASWKAACNPIRHPDKIDDQFLNCIKISNNTTLVALNQCLLWFNESLKPFKQLTPSQLYSTQIDFLRCFCSALSGFIIGCTGYPTAYKHEYGEK